MFHRSKSESPKHLSLPKTFADVIRQNKPWLGNIDFGLSYLTAVLNVPVLPTGNRQKRQRLAAALIHANAHDLSPRIYVVSDN